MNLSEIANAGGKLAAKEAFKEYRAAVAASLEKEIRTHDEKKLEMLRRQREADEAIMVGYRQLAFGRRLIDVRATIASGGLDTNGRPKIVVAQAQLERVSVRLDRDGGLTFDDPARRTNTKSAARITFPDRTFPGDRNRGDWSGIRATAIVPSIPPRFRPAYSLERYWILFEAEYLKPPVDPALLRPIGNGVAVMIAAWDLTPLERTVLGMTR